jgi:hypothetical protein
MRWYALGACLAVALLGPFLARPNAQRNQPIYPAYDGFLKNPDGSYTLSFAYFSHNAEVVTIPPGPNNSWSPNPADRQQPTTFRPGHWRFQCVMVVNSDFDGKLIWNLSYAGTTTGTSQRMMQSNYNLVEGAADLAKIDYAKAPRGVCLNRAPNVRVLGTAARGRGSPPAMTASVGEQVSLFGSVADEGLPRTGKLTTTWNMVKGPGNATFEDARSARTHATFSAPGMYELELTANDGELSTTARVNVEVAAGGR